MVSARFVALLSVALAAAASSVSAATVTFDCTRVPNICANDFYAINCVGKPTRLTRDSDSADAHRNANACRSPNRCSGNPSDSNSCDEYPFATAAQGGAGAVTRCVPVTENSRQGGTLSSFYTQNGIKNGDSYNVAFSNTNGIQYSNSCSNTGNEVIRREASQVDAALLPPYGRAMSEAPLYRPRKFVSEDGLEILMFEPRGQPGALDEIVGSRTYLADEDRFVQIVRAI